MKTPYLPLALLLLGCQTSRTHKIGIVYAGHFEILNKTEISEKWNDMLARNGIKSQLSTFRIRKEYDAARDSSYYYLYAESYDTNIKAATVLKRKENFFYTSKGNGFIVCSCPEGEPKRFDGQWLCESQTGEDDCVETILAEK